MTETPPRIRVLIVDDHIAVAESLYALLARDQSFELTELAHDANEAFRIVRERQPDVVLMDQALPGMSGAEATAHVIAARPQTAVIMFSGGMTDDELVTAVESGIRGYLPKGSHMAEVITAIHRAAAGEILLDKDELARLLRRARDRLERYGVPGGLERGDALGDLPCQLPIDHGLHGGSSGSNNVYLGYESSHERPPRQPARRHRARGA